MQATHASANQSDGLRTQGGHGGNGETLHKSGIFYYKKKRKKDDNKKTKPSPARHRMMRRSKILFHCKWPHCSGEFLKTFFLKTHTHTHTIWPKQRAIYRQRFSDWNLQTLTGWQEKCISGFGIFLILWVQNQHLKGQSVTFYAFYPSRLCHLNLSW